MKITPKSLILPVILALLVSGFLVSPEFQEIAAGIAVFLFGVLMLEDGFRLFSGGFLEALLARATKSVTRSVTFGAVLTTLVQSSSLVTILTISFLSAGLIPLLAGVGIVFGANLGTTTGAWLVAGLGMKVNIAAYAMPLLALGVVLVFQTSGYLRGTGYVMAGAGFLFLGIHHMKEGFDGFSLAFDLSRYAMTGLGGLLVYTALGMAATVVMQSSHATMVLVITALSAGQVSYENALALAIGANIGTTVTAVIGALSANFQGRQLAAAHLAFNLVTAAAAIALIGPLRQAVDIAGALLGIGDGDYTLKLALFHTFFNALGLALTLPVLGRFIDLVERLVPEPVSDLSRPRYLSEAVDEFPATIAVAMRKEVRHLYDNALELIAHGLNLHREALFAAPDVRSLVAASRQPVHFDFDARYEQRVKVLHSAILDFATRVGGKSLPHDISTRVYQLLDVAGRLVRAVKAVKHMRRNATRYTVRPQGAVTDLYDGLRTEIAKILVEIERMDRSPPEERNDRWLDDELARVDDEYRQTTARIEEQIRSGRISARVATSFLNDSGYAHEAMHELIEAARSFYLDPQEKTPDPDPRGDADDLGGQAADGAPGQGGEAGDIRPDPVRRDDTPGGA